MSRQLTALVFLFAIGLLGCGEPASEEVDRPIRLEKVRWRLADLSLDRPTIKLTRSGFFSWTGPVSLEELLDAFGDGSEEIVYLLIDKFVPFPEQEIDEIATVVIRSGGRFFYQKGSGAIDGLFFCREIREVLGDRRPD